MAKPRIYGMKSKYNPRLHLDMRYQKKQHQRNRERAQPSTPAPEIGAWAKNKREDKNAD